MKDKRNFPTPHTDRYKLLAIAVSIFFCFSATLLKAQAPPVSDDTVTAIANVTGNDEKISAWSYGNKVMVDLNSTNEAKATISIYQINGQLISQEKYTGYGVFIKEVPNLGTGGVIVVVTSGNSRLMRRLFVSNY